MDVPAPRSASRIASPGSVRGLLLVLLMTVGGAVAAADNAPQDIAKKKAEMLLRMQVRRAIDTGARWIASTQRPDGSFELSSKNPDGPFPQSRHRFGISTLCFYTLADCGYGVDREEIRKALAYLRKHYRSYMKGDYWPQASSYALSLFVLGLHNLFVKPGKRMQLDQRDRYGKRRKTEKNPCGYPAWARKLINDVLDWLMSHQAETGLFRYPDGFNNMGTGGRAQGMPPSHAGPEDLSNTQYVLLALWAGSRCGYDITPKVLERIALRLLEYQEKSGPEVDRIRDPASEPSTHPDGQKGRYAKPARPPPDKPEERDRARGFPYTLGRESTGSMTTAGLSSLVIVKAMLMERNALEADMRKKLDRGIWDGIAWLTHYYDLSSNPHGRGPGPGGPGFGRGPPGRMWQYYYLYGLERACVITGKRYLGAHDWYAEGARLLVDAQKNDGRWKPGDQLGGFGGGPGMGAVFQTDILDTCFALLFLKRATIIPKRPVLEGPVTTPSAK